MIVKLIVVSVPRLGNYSLNKLVYFELSLHFFSVWILNVSWSFIIIFIYSVCYVSTTYMASNQLSCPQRILESEQN